MHHSTTRLCSSWLSVGLSPVVPTGTSPWVPSDICQFTSERNAASSSEPFLKGVSRAVNDPLNFVFAAMDFLRNLRAAGELKRHSYRVCSRGERAVPGLFHRSWPLFCRGIGAQSAGPKGVC